MPYKTIIVALNQVSRADVLIDVAAELATRHDAHLIGLYAIPALRIYPSLAIHAPPVVIEASRRFFADNAAVAEKSFTDKTRKAGIRAEWRMIDSDTALVADSVIAHGLQAELIIAGQIDDAANDGVEADYCERIVMETGRPVLLVPNAGKVDASASKVVIGWNATRESARAAFDAIPLLKQAETVHLVWVDPQDDGDTAGDLPGAEMAVSLARHGIKCAAEAMPTDDLDEGTALLNRVSDIGADLLVMGAYGHSRLRQFVLGGATRTVMAEMTVPVLVSH